jgi:hypothetical protein
MENHSQIFLGEGETGIMKGNFRTVGAAGELLFLPGKEKKTLGGRARL